MHDYTYQKNRRFFAQHGDEMGSAVMDELRELGVKGIRAGFRGVYFEADMAGLCRVNYRSQLITRVLAPLITFDCHSERYLHRTAMKIRWSDFMRVSDTFAISATVSNSAIGHSQFAALRLKDAIADWFRETQVLRPDVDTVNPDLSINLHIHENKATISIDTSGGSLHRRGYRADPVEAPMQETLAAAIIRLSGWDGSRLLYDPMCGSGTLLAEALIRYCRVPAGMFRKKFGFEMLPDFDRTVWDKVRRESDSLIRELPRGLIAGSDIAKNAVTAARANTGRLPGGDNVRILQKDFRKHSGLENGVIVCNPPYGIRSGREEDMADLYHELGEYLKHKCTGSEAYVYIGERSLLRNMALRKSWKKEMKNGGLDGILVKFELY